MVADEVKKQLSFKETDVSRDLQWTKSQMADLQKKVDKFEKASGIDIQWGWDLENVGKAVSLLKTHSPEAILKQYKFISKSVKDLARDIDVYIDQAKTSLPKIEQKAPSGEKEDTHAA